MLSAIVKEKLNLPADNEAVEVYFRNMFAVKANVISDGSVIIDSQLFSNEKTWEDVEAFIKTLKPVKQLIQDSVLDLCNAIDKLNKISDMVQARYAWGHLDGAYSLLRLNNLTLLNSIEAIRDLSEMMYPENKDKIILPDYTESENQNG